MKHPFKKSALKFLGRFVAAGLGFAALLLGLGWAFRPDLTVPPVTHAEEELKAVEELRDTTLKPDAPQIIQEVDYSRKSKAQWWPKGESPILAELVEEGKLEVVEKRVGPEPVVLKGVDGVGNYGGTWVRVVPSAGSVRGICQYELRCGTFTRFPPQRFLPGELKEAAGDGAGRGEDQKPGSWMYPNFLARKIDVSEDNKVYTIHLREKVRWSDGHEFTSEDIIFWWRRWAKWERTDPKTGEKERLGWVPETVKIRGKEAKIEAPDDYTVTYTFPEPNGIFLDFNTGARGSCYTPLPAHYLRKYHPEDGRRDLIEKAKKAYGLSSDKDVFDHFDDLLNPLRPRLGPWIPARYTTDGPVILVRNPYYSAVDPKGNQLPYLDKIIFLVKNPNMMEVAIANGEVSVQQAPYRNYTLLMTQRKQKGYEVYHWVPDIRSSFAIYPNLNRTVYPGDRVSQLKHRLLNDKRFRQALSLAINREEIIEAEWNGVGKPSQIAPDQRSIYGYPDLSDAFVEYNPQRANELLDEIGLTQRDVVGFRKYKDGTPLVFFVNVSQGAKLMGPAEFVIRDWARVGIRAIARERGGAILQTEKFARKQDFIFATGVQSGLDILTGGRYTPENRHCMWATGWGRWYHEDGMIGSEKAEAGECVKPPGGHPILEAMAKYDEACRLRDRLKRMSIYSRALEIAADNLWNISVSTPQPVLIVVKDGMKSVPKTAVWGFIDTMWFNCAYPETWYWENPTYAPGEREQIKGDIDNIVKLFKAGVELPARQTGRPEVKPETGTGKVFSAVIRWACLAGAVVLLVLLVVKRPYIGRRLLIMIPTLAIISIIVFTIIQIPPGDYLTTYMEQLRLQGVEISGQQIRDLEERFHLKEPMWKQYCTWVGLTWFFTGQENDKGLLQGDLGMSMETRKPVNELVGDRILLTVLISLGTVLLTWVIAVPIGIYSAVKQYSIGDYVLTVIGFIGMCVPPFLLALVLVYLADVWFGVQVSGLFSPKYAAQPDWSWGKFADLLEHIWLPILVLGVGGTAGMIRVMRGNLLDELKKPYVVTARAKGVRPMRLLIKYPVRLALNPFISGIGGLFPMLVSGGAIVAMVLSLPTVGPLMLNALMSQDMYLAGSMLMVLSVLGVVGVLVSDLLLLWLDPRIRFERTGR
ncbi:MAG: ABC transporter substrate-binding protein [Planctomycetota bacterium]|jgi:ABC-type dipeptide/oligopeptide/nickel transport system permease component/ABC-type transport system substrate-binding protein